MNPCNAFSGHPENVSPWEYKMPSPSNLVFHQHGVYWCSLCSWKDYRIWYPLMPLGSLYSEDGSYENGLVSLHAFCTPSMTRNHTEVLEAPPLCRLSALSPSRFHAYTRLFFSIARRQHRHLQLCCWWRQNWIKWYLGKDTFLWQEAVVFHQYLWRSINLTRCRLIHHFCFLYTDGHQAKVVTGSGKLVHAIMHFLFRASI